MATKSRKKSRKKSGLRHGYGKILSTLLILLIVIGACYFIYNHFSSSKDNKETETTQTAQVVDNKKNTESAEVNKPATEEQSEPVDNSAETEDVKGKITGPWVSTSEQVYLKFKDGEYSIDLSVYGEKPISGKYSVDGHAITFTNAQEPCKDEKGVYEVKFEDDCIILTCKDDKCAKRSTTLGTMWKRIRLSD